MMTENPIEDTPANGGAGQHGRGQPFCLREFVEQELASIDDSDEIVPNIHTNSVDSHALKPIIRGPAFPPANSLPSAAQTIESDCESDTLSDLNCSPVQRYSCDSNSTLASISDLGSVGMPGICCRILINGKSPLADSTAVFPAAAAALREKASGAHHNADRYRKLFPSLSDSNMSKATLELFEPLKFCASPTNCPRVSHSEEFDDEDDTGTFVSAESDEEVPEVGDHKGLQAATAFKRTVSDVTSFLGFDLDDGKDRRMASSIRKRAATDSQAEEEDAEGPRARSVSFAESLKSMRFSPKDPPVVYRPERSVTLESHLKAAAAREEAARQARIQAELLAYYAIEFPC